jgi:hypothetical protein
MHLMQSCSAFMVRGLDIVAQISRFGAPADKHYVPDIHHAEPLDVIDAVLQRIHGAWNRHCVIGMHHGFD